MGSTSRKEQDKQRRRDLIIKAAEEVFRRKGYQGTTMEEVAEEAEFSKGTLYLYFGSKFALFAELSNRVLIRVLAEFEEISSESILGREMIVRMLRFWASTASSNIRRFRLVISWMASDERPDSHCPGTCAHRENVGMIIAALSKAIAVGQSDRSIGNPGLPVTLACQLWSGMTGALLFSSRIDDLADDFPVPIECEGFMDGFVDLLSAGLAAREDERK